MNNRKFERAARMNRAKAVMLTILFHVGLIAGLGLNGNLTDYLPDSLKDLIGIKTEQVAEEKLPQP